MHPLPRTVFMGSPDFALPTLRALADIYPVCGVVTQPDRPAGRGQKLAPPPVKQLAEDLDLPVIQPRRLREPEAFDQLRAWAPDLIVVAAYGQILRPEVLDLPPHGCLNVHASLLPRWRGAAPVQAAILHGDPETGVTIMKMDPGLDTGAMVSRRAIPIEVDDTAALLADKLASLGADLLIETLPGYLSGELVPQPQEDALATYAPMLKKEDGQLDLSQPADRLARQVRAYHPWPGSQFTWAGQSMKVLRAHAVPGAAGPGKRMVHAKMPALGTGDGLLVLDEVQPAGKKAMPGQAFLAGARGWEGDTE